MPSAILSFLSLLTLLLLSTALSLGLTYAPCYSTLCSESFFPLQVRISIGVEAALILGLALLLLLRINIPRLHRISTYDLTKSRLPVFGKRISIGGLLAFVWILGMILWTTAYWEGPIVEYWSERAPDWEQAGIMLIVVTNIAHHADMLLGLVLIPVGRNSLLGRTFKVHQTTLLFAHNWLAYLAILDSLAHGIVYFILIGVYNSVPTNDPRRELFDVNNPTLTTVEARQKGNWSALNFAAGLIAWVAMAVMVITSLPWMRRRYYNLFYYCHISGAIIAVVFASIHASTNFYYILPGLLLWIYDVAWRVFGGDSGLKEKVIGSLVNAGEGWYRITLPPLGRAGHDQDAEKQVLEHPLQSYNLVIPAISKMQPHALTVAKAGDAVSGPVFLFQPATAVVKRSPKKQDAEWTWKLGRLAIVHTPPASSGSDETESEVSEKPAQPTPLEMRLEGPFSPPDRDYETADHIVCIVGGTGLTGALSLANWWLKAKCQATNNFFTLVWSVRNRNIASLQEWADLKTRAPANMDLVLHISSQNGRMDSGEILRSLCECKRSTAEPSLWVYASGPPGLLNSVEDSCLAMERELQPRPWSEKSPSGLGVRRMSHHIAKWEN